MRKSRTGIASALTLATAMGLSTAAMPQDDAPATPAVSATFNSASFYTDFDQLQYGEIADVRADTKATPRDMVNAMQKARVIYISEQHDNYAAHLVQLAVIKELNKTHPGKVVIGMEMFRRSDQPELDHLKDGSLSMADLNDLFDNEWAMDWRPAYQPVLDFIHDNNIPVIGLRPTEEMERHFDRGEPDNYPDMDQNDAQHRAFNMAILKYFAGAHGHAVTDTKVLEVFYQKQLLRDEVMGETVANFLAAPENKDKIMVVMAGGDHVEYGLGIPKRAARRVPHDYMSIIPVTDGINADPSIPLPMGDYAWKVPYYVLTPQPAAPAPNKKQDSQPAP